MFNFFKKKIDRILIKNLLYLLSENSKNNLKLILDVIQNGSNVRIDNKTDNLKQFWGLELLAANIGCTIGAIESSENLKNINIKNLKYHLDDLLIKEFNFNKDSPFFDVINEYRLDSLISFKDSINPFSKPAVRLIKNICRHDPLSILIDKSDPESIFPVTKIAITDLLFMMADNNIKFLT